MLERADRACGADTQTHARREKPSPKRDRGTEGLPWGRLATPREPPGAAVRFLDPNFGRDESVIRIWNLELEIETRNRARGTGGLPGGRKAARSGLVGSQARNWRPTRIGPPCDPTGAPESREPVLDTRFGPQRHKSA